MEHNLHEGHRDRFRKKFIEEGGEAFEDHELLEILLYYAIPRISTNEIAHRLIDEFGSLANLMEAEPETISKKCKVSMNTAVLITLIPQMAKKYYLSKSGEKTDLSSCKKAGDYIKNYYLGEMKEKFLILCLNSQNKLIKADFLSEGTIDEVNVYTREIVEFVINNRAYAIIMAHNHPGGSLTPSQDDIDLTKTIISALDPIGIKVRDHIIVSGENFLSLKQQNYF